MHLTCTLKPGTAQSEVPSGLVSGYGADFPLLETEIHPHLEQRETPHVLMLEPWSYTGHAGSSGFGLCRSYLGPEIRESRLF